MPFVNVRGRPIYYERHGAGPAILLAHGAGSNAATWWQQLPAFSPHYTCITMDIRCFGRSAAPVEEFSLDTFTQDAIAVLDAAGVEAAVVVGQSLGGMIGLRMALRHPSRVRGFVACDTTLAVDHPELLRLVNDRLASASAMRIEQRSLGRWFQENRPALVALYAQINHFNPSVHSIPASAWQAAMAGQMAPPSLVPMPALAQVACPTLFLAGREDPLVTETALRDVAARVSGSEVVLIDNAGHSAYFEQAETFNDVVLDFLRRRIDWV